MNGDELGDDDLLTTYKFYCQTGFLEEKTAAAGVYNNFIVFFLFTIYFLKSELKKELTKFLSISVKIFITPLQDIFSIFSSLSDNTICPNYSLARGTSQKTIPINRESPACPWGSENTRIFVHEKGRRLFGNFGKQNYPLNFPPPKFNSRMKKSWAGQTSSEIK